MLGCSLVRINFGGARLARYSNLDARCSLDTRRVFFRPQIGRFLANFWLNLGKIMGLFLYQKVFIHFWLENSTKSADFGPISNQICDLVESWNFFGRFYGVFIMAVMLDTRSVFEPWCSSSLDTRTFQKRGARARSVLELFDARPSLISGQGFPSFFAKIWQKLKKNLVWKFMEESSIKYLKIHKWGRWIWLLIGAYWKTHVLNGLLIKLFCLSSDFDETWWSCSTHE